jgi:hypothetical protein
MNAAPPLPHQPEPTMAGVRVRPGLALGLYVLLLLSAGLAFWAQRTPTAPGLLSQASPFIFLTFAVGFSAYRLALVLARRYSAFKAFFQIILAALFFMLLLLPQVAQPVGTTGLPLAELLLDPEPRVRALAAEAAGWRRDESAGPQLVRLLSDASPVVREAAHGALQRMNAGVDLGSADDLASRAAWKDRFP